jgi:hypothetical protein
MNSIFRFLTPFVFILLSFSAQARTIYFGTDIERVPLVFGDPTVFRFPSEVQTILHAERFEVSPASSDSPSYKVLSVKPRFATGSSEVTFMLGDGTVIKISLISVPHPIPGKTDSVFDFKPRDGQIQGTDEPEPQGSLAGLDLMKLIIRGDEVTGYEVKSVSRTLSPGIKGVSIRLVRLYSGSQLNGYIFEITNTTQHQKLFINVRNLMLGDPNVALIGMVDQDVIEPEGTANSKTYLRVVAKPTSRFDELKLPVQVIERKAEHE